MSGSDPVEALAREVRTLRNALVGGPLMPTDEDRAIAAQMLAGVWAQDWRIVRLADNDSFPGEDVQITDEWSPVPEAVR